MTPLLPIVAGLVALGVGFVVLRSFGSRYRVGRLLRATPVVSVADAIAIAAPGSPPRYVRVEGRIDSEEDFHDDAHRPLVLRRTRIELGEGRGWRTIDDQRESVPFEVREGLDAIAVDADALDDGLVVLPREALGTAADIADRVPEGTDPAAPARLRVDQVSSVEHAVVLGVPVLDADGHARMTAGLGRPLVLSTLAQDEAMRVLAGGSRRLAAAAIALAVGLLLLIVGLAWALAGLLLAPATALAASPSPAAAGGDPRSSGQGPGLVGDPAFAILAVVAIGVIALVGTLVYLRFTGGRRTS